MASKNKQPNRQPDHVCLKYVKKAGMWVRTTVQDGKIRQEWLDARD